MKDCSNTHVTYDLEPSAHTVLTVSIGNTPASVFLAIANLPVSPTAFHPPNSLISVTLPFSTFRAFPKVSISWTFLLFLIKFGRFFNSFDNVAKFASAAGAVYVWLAEASVSVVVEPVRNGLLASSAFPLRSSLEPEFAIELDSVAFSVFVDLIPTVAFPFVASTAGASFFSSGFVCNFVVAVTNLACACDNSACVFALFKTDFASFKTVFNWFTLSSVLLAYVSLANLPSISAIKSIKDFLFRVSTSVGFDSVAVLFPTAPSLFVVTISFALAPFW